MLRMEPFALKTARSYPEALQLWAANPGAIYYASRSAYQVPPSALDRPVLDSEAGAPAPRRGIAPSCGGTTLAHWSDPNDDAPMQVDLTATKSPGIFPAGNYQGTVTVRCE